MQETATVDTAIGAVNTTLDSALGRVPRTTPVGACPVCGAFDGQFFFKSPDRIWGTPGEFTYRRCLSCRTVFQDPRVVNEDLSLCYPKEYFTHESAEEMDPTPIADEADRRRLSWLRERIRSMVADTVRGERSRGIPGLLGSALARSRRLRERAVYDSVIDELIPRSRRPMKALDIGCGAGRLLMMLDRVGWEAAGVEWDPSAASVARRVSGRPVFEGDFRDLGATLERYDLVVMHHVFEHVDDPAGTLSTIKDLLLPGGRAVLMFPNSSSVGSRVFRSACCNWDPPRHLVLPDKDGLTRLANANGLTTVQTRTSSRHAAMFFALSRSLKGSGRVDPNAIVITAPEKLLSLVARAMVFLGFPVGEELFVTFERREDPAGHTQPKN